MKSILILFALISHICQASEIYEGTVTDAEGTYYEMKGQPCQVDVKSRDDDDAVFSITVKSVTTSYATVKHGAWNLIERYYYDYGTHTEPVPVPGFPGFVDMDAQMISFQGDGSVKFREHFTRYNPHMVYWIDGIYECSATKKP